MRGLPPPSPPRAARPLARPVSPPWAAAAPPCAPWSRCGPLSLPGQRAAQPLKPGSKGGCGSRCTCPSALGGRFAAASWCGSAASRVVVCGRVVAGPSFPPGPAVLRGLPHTGPGSSGGRYGPPLLARRGPPEVGPRPRCGSGALLATAGAAHTRRPLGPAPRPPPSPGPAPPLRGSLPAWVPPPGLPGAVFRLVPGGGLGAGRRWGGHARSWLGCRPPLSPAWLVTAARPLGAGCLCPSASVPWGSPLRPPAPPPPLGAPGSARLVKGWSFFAVALRLCSISAAGRGAQVHKARAGCSL